MACGREVSSYAISPHKDMPLSVVDRQAATLLKPSAGYLATPGTKVDWLARWSKAVPEVRRWAEENREALAVYRQGAERPDALDPAIGLIERASRRFGALWSFRPLVLLEASRLEEHRRHGRGMGLVPRHAAHHPPRRVCMVTSTGGT